MVAGAAGLAGNLGRKVSQHVTKMIPRWVPRRLQKGSLEASKWLPGGFWAASGVPGGPGGAQDGVLRSVKAEVEAMLGPPKLPLEVEKPPPKIPNPIFDSQEAKNDALGPLPRRSG